MSPMLSPPIRRLLALLGPERGRWTLVGGLMSASALGEVASPYFTGHVTDRVAQEDATAAVWPLVLVGLGSAITELACDSMAALALTRARDRLQHGAVAAVLRGDVPGPGGSLGDTPGTVAARVTGDAEAVHSALGDVLVPGLWALTRAVSLLTMVAWLSPVLGLLTLLALPLFLLLPHAVGRIQQDLARQVRAAQASTTALALESLEAMGTVRAFGHEAGVTKRVRQCLAQGHQLEQKEALVYAAGLWASGFPALVLKLALLFLGGRLVAAGTVTRGELVTILMCQLRFTKAVEAILLYVPVLAKAIGSSETLLELLEQARTVTLTGPPSPVTPGGHETTWTRGLCLKDVWMSYPGRSEPVLKGVSLSLRPGEVVAVLAPPGGGKSSLVAAALGLRPLAGGAVLLNGIPLTPHSDPALREQVTRTGHPRATMATPRSPSVPCCCPPVTKPLHCVPMATLGGLLSPVPTATPGFTPGAQQVPTATLRSLLCPKWVPTATPKSPVCVSFHPCVTSGLPWLPPGQPLSQQPWLPCHPMSSAHPHCHPQVTPVPNSFHSHPCVISQLHHDPAATPWK
ncbi:LOW QUALITY PROTEIN: antigen peptide transporter 1-like [Anomalospiza imberbis]|uniref:LOW QUALITY PROTEIN: antigen peptide transporter 1-like n=1 Tax=Anomalospiza imberbis TaxID=187417 RepID=UPI00358F9577